jgi:hypothetical protein
VLVPAYDIPARDTVLPLVNLRLRHIHRLPRLRLSRTIHLRTVGRPGPPGVLVVPRLRAVLLHRALRVPVPLVHRLLVQTESVHVQLHALRLYTLILFFSRVSRRCTCST